MAKRKSRKFGSPEAAHRDRARIARTRAVEEATAAVLEAKSGDCTAAMAQLFRAFKREGIAEAESTGVGRKANLPALRDVRWRVEKAFSTVAQYCKVTRK